MLELVRRLLPLEAVLRVDVPGFDLLRDAAWLRREVVERDRVLADLRAVVLGDFARERDLEAALREPVFRVLVARPEALLEEERLAADFRDMLRDVVPARLREVDRVAAFRELRLAAVARPREEVEALRRVEDNFAVERERALPLERPLPDSAAFAVSRETSLLKLLFWPRAVVSWCRSARPRSSNFSNQSSHEISSRESAPLYPGKSRRRIPISFSAPVRRTHAGRAPRSSAHVRISS
ncbi:MAG TPA: hypothetical protein VN577_05495 [Terriglobales bacterium]|nr:hypothetical protein [Terriglobales bacterium]